MDYVYHYTDGEGANGILESGEIRKSTSKMDASFGKGVYFTEMKPNENKGILLKNNYDDGKKLEETNRNKVDFVFAIQKDGLEGLKKCDTTRNVLLYEGDVKLKDVRVRYGPTDGEQHTLPCVRLGLIDSSIFKNSYS